MSNPKIDFIKYSKCVGSSNCVRPVLVSSQPTLKSFLLTYDCSATKICENKSPRKKMPRNYRHSTWRQKLQGIIFLTIFRNICSWTIPWMKAKTRGLTRNRHLKHHHAMGTGAFLSSANLRHLSRVFPFPVYRFKSFKYVDFTQIFSRNFYYNYNLKGFIL